MPIFRVILFTFALVILCFQAGGAVVFSQEVPTLLEQGTRLLQGKKPEEALQVFQQVVQAAPDRPDGHFYSAIAYQQLRRFPEALAAIERAVLLLPENVTFLFRRGLIQEGMGKNQEAIETYQKLVGIGEVKGQSDPEVGSVLPGARRRLLRLQVDQYLRTSQTLYSEGKFESSLQELQAAQDLQPENPIIHYAMGLNYLKQEKAPLALRSFREAARLDPTYADAHFQIGLTAEGLRLYDISNEGYQRFLELAPESPQAGLASGGVQRMQKALELAKRFETVVNAIRNESWDQALKENEALDALQPGNPVVNYNFGVILQHLDRDEEAVSWLKKTMEIDSNYKDAYYQLGLAYDKMGFFSEALTAYETYLQKEPEKKDDKTQKIRERVELLHSGLGKREQAKEAVAEAQEALEKKDIEGAIRSAEALRALSESDPRIHLVLGGLYREAGRAAEALGALERAVSLDPTQADAWWILGDLSETLKNLERAITAFETIARLEPESPRGGAARNRVRDLRIRNYFEQAKVLKEKGDLEGALHEIQAVLSIAPNHPLAFFNAGILYDRLNEPEKALFMLQRAVSLAPDYLPAYLQVGLIMEGMNQFQQAGAFYLKVLDLQKTGEEAQFARQRLQVTTELSLFEKGLQGIVDLLNKHNLIKARKEAENLLILQPRNYLLYYLLAKIYSSEIRYEEAVTALRKGVEINPLHARSWLSLGEVLFKLERFAEAREAYEKARETGKGTREEDLAEIGLRGLRPWRGFFSLSHTLSTNVSYGVRSDPEVSSSYSTGLSYLLFQEKKYQATIAGTVSQSVFYKSQLRSTGLVPSFNFVLRPIEAWTLSFATSQSRGYLEEEYVSRSSSYSMNLGISSAGIPSYLGMGYSLSFPRSLRSQLGDVNQSNLNVSWSQGLGGLYGIGGAYSFTVNRNLHPEGSNYGYRSQSLSLNLTRILFPQVPLTLSYAFALTQYMNPDTTSLFLQYRRNLQQNIGLSLSAPLSEKVTFSTSYQYVDNDTNLPRPTAETQQTLEDILVTPIPTVGGGFVSQVFSMSFSVSF